MDYDFVCRSYDSVFHDKNVLCMKITVVFRRVAVVSYINVFFSLT